MTLREKVVLLVVAVLFGLLVWPGTSQLVLLSATNGQALVKVNKLTGGVKMVATTIPQPPPAQPAPAVTPGMMPSPPTGVTK